MLSTDCDKNERMSIWDSLKKGWKLEKFKSWTLNIWIP